MPPETHNEAAALEHNILASRKMRPGDKNYRAYVGPPAQYDFMGATQFRLLTGLGLCEDHHLVDIGCGSLRAGRLLLQYLLPGRYIGIEPNAWLWQEAFDREIGRDVQSLKSPSFSTEADFQLSSVANGSADFIIAQSIYSHTGLDLFETSVQASARCLAADGQFLFTAIPPSTQGAQNMPQGAEFSGWLYPGCTTFAQQAVKDVCTAAGLHVQQLAWFHPRQTWFRATKNPALLLTSEMETQLGTGKPLFDTRF